MYAPIINAAQTVIGTRYLHILSLGGSLWHTLPAGCSMPTGQKYHFSCRITNILDKIRTLRNVPMRLSCREKDGANRMLGRTSRVFQTRRRLSRAARSGLAFRRQQGGNKRKKENRFRFSFFVPNRMPPVILPCGCRPEECIGYGPIFLSGLPNCRNGRPYPGGLRGQASCHAA